MLILFLFIFLGCIAILAKPRIEASRWMVFGLVLYCCVTQDAIFAFFEIHYNATFIKFVIYCSIVLIPAIFLILHRPKGKIRFATAILISFLALLPFTRPVHPFARAASGWKLSHFPLRYAENISRLAPNQKDVEVLKENCSQLNSNIRTRLIAHLRSFPFTSKTNECVTLAGNWKRPVPQMRSVEFHPEEEWKAEYHHGNENRRIEILKTLQQQRNPCLIDEAIRNLDQENDLLIISSVNYLRDVSGKGIGNDSVRWKYWREHQQPGIQMQLMAQGKKTAAAEAGFSALEVQADLFEAREGKQDFLRIYLANHFPKSVSDFDLLELQRSLAEAKNLPESRSVFYKRGMLQFFIALARTKRLAEGQEEVDAEVDASWRVALESFQQSGFSGEGISQEIHAILNQADSNRDGKLSKPELISILDRSK